MRPRTSGSRHRPPAVSGIFYPSDAGALRHIISKCFEGCTNSLEQHGYPLGVVCPHAGYAYSGVVAAHSYAAMATGRPSCAILVGPDHRGMGHALSLSGHTHWDTPFGSSPVYDIPVGECGASPDVQAHAPEHGLEVQLPMIQYLWGDVPICPILMRDQSPASAVRLGRHLAGSISGRPVFIASSDMTHYAAEDTARRKDGALIDAILGMDIELFYHVLHNDNVTACGYGAIAAAMEYCKARGATSGRLLMYDTSATTSGDSSNVVGYCSIAFY